MKGLFSSRTAWDLTESSLAGAVREVRAAGGRLIDLTVSNPTVCGFAYRTAEVLGAFEQVRSLTYDPEPRGIVSAREAVAGYYAQHGAAVSAEDVALTVSTSEAYSFLFRLLCEPGDEVLVAQPSYPLFDFLAALDDVTLVNYPLFYDYGWWIDFAELERRVSPRTKAIVVVHPNNPTGHCTVDAERARLEEVAERNGLALIVDEVFLDYGLEAPVRTFAGGAHPCLTFVLSGMSKVAALPQMKVAWILAEGSEALKAEALGRLEVIADTFLSVSGPAQHALPMWLDGRREIEQQILLRVTQNLDTLSNAAGITSLPVQAGWSAVLQLPQRVASFDLAERLVQEAGVIVHPASFYGMTGGHRAIVSLIGPVDAFAEGIANLSAWSNGR